MTSMPYYSARILVVLLVVAVFAGCDDKRRHQSSDGLSFATVDPPVNAAASPVQAAEVLLKAVATAQQARAHGLGSAERKQKYDRALGGIWSLTARKEVHEYVLASRSPTIPRDVTEAAAVTLIIESWISDVAHYADGISYDSARVIPDNPQAECTVSFEAVSPDDAAKLASIQDLIAKDPPKDKDGKPASAASPIFLEALRAKTIQAGFNIPIKVAIDISMKKTESGWRAIRVGVGTGMSRPRMKTGTTLPTS